MIFVELTRGIENSDVKSRGGQELQVAYLATFDIFHRNRFLTAHSYLTHIGERSFDLGDFEYGCMWWLARDGSLQNKFIILASTFAYL